MAKEKGNQEFLNIIEDGPKIQKESLKEDSIAIEEEDVS